MKELKCLLKKAAVIIFQDFFALFSRDMTERLPKGPVLAIAPHPDDETFGCGAAIARLTNEGRRARIVAVTDGSAATQSKIISPARLAAMRHDELKHAAARLGVETEDVVLLNFPDGKASEHVDEIARKLAAEIRGLAPGLIFSAYCRDKSSDHRAVAAALESALKQTGYGGTVYEYPIWFYPLHALRHMLALTPLLTHRRIRANGYLAAKNAAVAEHRSQTENLTGEAEWTYFDKHLTARFLRPYELFFEKRFR